MRTVNTAFTMSEVVSEANTPEKPVENVEEVIFPPFPAPTSDDFDEDIAEEERKHYEELFFDVSAVKTLKLHCTACDRHLGSSSKNENRMRPHPMLRTLMCKTCHTFYNSGEFEKGDDGSELYCRWCGQGGQVYCCSQCPHVFCAKCVKRNLGIGKIKEIESNDDWKCFKCNPRCLWDLRAVCWALLRYCALKNKITFQTEDGELKEAYKKDCAVDYTQCCKQKINKRKSDINKKKEDTPRKNTAVVPSKPKFAAGILSPTPVPVQAPPAVPVLAAPSSTTMTPTIQVKKFASINLEEAKPEKKAIKRMASPKTKVMKNPISIAPYSNIIGPAFSKKMKIHNIASPNTNLRFDKPLMSYTNIRPKPFMPQMLPKRHFNGFPVPNDNINLSLDNLTQGLDMHTVNQNNDVVCTPDFPLEPLCEVTEDNMDDDVECITPAPMLVPKPPQPAPPLPSLSSLLAPPPLVPRAAALHDLSADNIIQMTENDVTVNSATGGLKFRVDPQTLSSKKMYRLPDGRIFAINANPNMPGGYSATIVAVTENTGNKTAKGATYAAKLSTVNMSKPSPVSTKPRILNTAHNLQKKKQKSPKVKITQNKNVDSPRELDFTVPVEWYRHNLIDAVDSVEYAIPRLKKLKKECTTLHLRTRSVDEMRTLTRSLERFLNTSINRFNEIRENLQKDFRQYLSRKMGQNNSEDDDDVEILPNIDDSDDPIFIDENSVDSNVNNNENQEVDLTSQQDSEHNDSAEKILSSDEPILKCNEQFIDSDSNVNNNILKTTDQINTKTNGDLHESNSINDDEELEQHVDQSAVNKSDTANDNVDIDMTNIENEDKNINLNEKNVMINLENSDKNKEIVMTSLKDSDKDKNEEVVARKNLEGESENKNETVNVASLENNSNNKNEENTDTNETVNVASLENNSNNKNEENTDTNETVNVASLENNSNNKNEENTITNLADEEQNKNEDNALTNTRKDDTDVHNDDDELIEENVKDTLAENDILKIKEKACAIDVTYGSEDVKLEDNEMSEELINSLLADDKDVKPAQDEEEILS